MERRKEDHRPQSNGTNTPRDLSSRLKILEIYVLHVLPRNSEWEYAREFIAMSEMLDDERKEAFLQALQNIQDEKEFDSKREEELKKQREQQLDDARRRDEDARTTAQARNPAAQVRKVQRVESQKVTEHDFGIDGSPIGQQDKVVSRHPHGISQSSNKSSGTKKESASRAGRTFDRGSGNANQTPTNMIRRFSLLINALQDGVISMGRNVRSHPMVLIRMLAFTVALLMALSRQDIRDRLVRARDASWQKLKQTIGMGVKVSYI